MVRFVKLALFFLVPILVLLSTTSRFVTVMVNPILLKMKQSSPPGSKLSMRIWMMTRTTKMTTRMILNLT